MKNQEIDYNEEELYDDEIPEKDADAIDIITPGSVPVESEKTLIAKNHDIGRRS